MGPNGGVTIGGDAIKPIEKKETKDEKFDPTMFTHPQGHPRKWVILRDTGLANESKFPYFGLNGFGTKIQKNVPVKLPIPLINAMKGCIITKVEKSQEEGGEDTIRDIPRFSFDDVPADKIPELELKLKEQEEAARIKK
ncbi:MAG: hypothetical protein LLG40_13250 [Deltaproteobacteria bacterium]|nr:hypothetical protein [Deltaproteobacteria bacterium]